MTEEWIAFDKVRQMKEIERLRNELEKQEQVPNVDHVLPLIYANAQHLKDIKTVAFTAFKFTTQPSWITYTQLYVSLPKEIQDMLVIPVTMRPILVDALDQY